MAKLGDMGRGGNRAGAGRKAADGADCSYAVAARVDAVVFSLMEELGEGSISLGVRRGFAELIERRKADASPAKRIVKVVPVKVLSEKKAAKAVRVAKLEAVLNRPTPAVQKKAIVLEEPSWTRPDGTRHNYWTYPIHEAEVAERNAERLRIARGS